MKTTKFFASGAIALALAAVVCVLTIQNVVAVCDGSYANVWTAWCSNWAVAVMAWPWLRIRLNTVRTGKEFSKVGLR